jgi:hypothetical protein
MGMRALALVMLGFVAGAAVIHFTDSGTSDSPAAATAGVAATQSSTGGHTHAHVGDATLTGDTPCEKSNSIGGEASSANAGREHGHTGFFKWRAMDPATRTILTQQLNIAHQVTVDYPTVASAEAAGYRMTTRYVPCIGAHYINNRYLGSFDTAHPAMLLYDGTDPGSKIVGLSYAQLSGNKTPEGFAGRNDLWHRHNLNGGLCIREGVVVGAESISQADCAARGGVKISLDSLWMMHAWVADGWPSAWGIFSAEHPDLGGVINNINADPTAVAAAAKTS